MLKGEAISADWADFVDARDEICIFAEGYGGESGACSRRTNFISGWILLFNRGKPDGAYKGFLLALQRSGSMGIPGKSADFGFTSKKACDFYGTRAGFSRRKGLHWTGLQY